MSENDAKQETLLEFPCDYGVKAMGETSDQLESVVVEIVRRHVMNLSEMAVTSKQSSGGKFTSITVSFEAQSKAQLEAIYKELSEHELIKYAL